MDMVPVTADAKRAKFKTMGVEEAEEADRFEEDEQEEDEAGEVEDDEDREADNSEDAVSVDDIEIGGEEDVHSDVNPFLDIEAEER